MRHTCRHTIFLILILLSCTWEGCGGTLSPKFPESHKDQLADSLNHVLEQIIRDDSKDAIELAYQAYEQARKHQLPTYQIDFLSLMGDCFYNEVRIAESLDSYNRAFELASKVNDTIRQAKILNKRGIAHLRASEGDLAVEDIGNSILLLDEMQNISVEKREKLKLNAYTSLVSLYTYQNKFDIAEAYLDSCRKTLEFDQNSREMARFLYELAWYQQAQGDEASIVKAISNFHKGAAIYLQIGDTSLAGSSNYQISNVYDAWAVVIYSENQDQHNQRSLNYVDSSYAYMERYLSQLEKDKDSTFLASSLQNLAYKNYFDKGNISLAKEQIYQSLQIAGRQRSAKDSSTAYQLLADIYAQLDQPDSVLLAFENYLIANKNNAKIEAEKAQKFAEVSFETEKKELENQKLRVESRQRFQRTIYVASVLALILLAITLYYYLSNKNKKALMSQQAKINQQLVIDLMKEQTIESLNSRLDGEEKERKRIAKELHDTLGGTLAAVKLSMEGLKKQLDEKAQERFEYTKKLLQTAYEETRQLSHDMMALPLKHLGLEPSIRALCETINMSGKLEVKMNTVISVPLNFADEEQTHLYRILQELLQNVIKHAKASLVEVNMINSDEGFILQVKDNGRGFKQGKKKEGMGLSNIRDRVTGLRGELMIASKEGEGSTVSVYIPNQRELDQV